MFDLNPLFAEFRKVYYTIPVMAIAELLAIILAFRYRQKNRLWAAFTIYLLTDFIILLAALIIKTMPACPQDFIFKFHNFTNTIVSLSELICYYYFFYHIFSGASYKIALKLIAIIYTILALVFLAGIPGGYFQRITYITDLLGTTEFILILPFCLAYFKKIITSTSGQQIFSRPGFWITTGIFFFSIISIPGYLLYDYIATHMSGLRYPFLAIFYYLPFTINFLFLAKAFSLNRNLES